MAYADLRFRRISGDVADIDKAGRELAKQQAKTKPADKRIIELQEKFNEEKNCARKPSGSQVARRNLLSRHGLSRQSSAAVHFDGRSSPNLGELRRMMAGGPSHLDELYQQPQHERGPPLA